MFDQHQLEPKPSPRAQKAFVGSIVGFLIGLGLCGVDSHFYPQSEFGGSGLATLGAFLLFSCALVFIISSLILIQTKLADYFRKP